MPVVGKCPNCHSDLPPVGRFCGKCGMDFSVSRAPSRAFFKKIAGGLAGFGLFIVISGGFFYYSSQPAIRSNVSASPDPIPQNNDVAPAMNTPVIEGKVYTVGPSAWTVIDVRPPVTPGQYKYDVRFEGINHFRAWPDGDARREFIYPNGQNLQPYQMSGQAQTFWVQALDGGVHQVRVKYVRTARTY
jgi:hypothetical protein